MAGFRRVGHVWSLANQCSFKIVMNTFVANCCLMNIIHKALTVVILVNMFGLVLVAMVKNLLITYKIMRPLH